MPIIHIYAAQPSAPSGLLRELCEQVCTGMSIPMDKTWALWHPLKEENHWRPDWARADAVRGPTVIIHCQQKHSSENVTRMMNTVRTRLASGLGCPPESVFVAVQRVSPQEVLELPPAAPGR